MPRIASSRTGWLFCASVVWILPLAVAFDYVIFAE
jgi:hypothetical protein